MKIANRPARYIATGVMALCWLTVLVAALFLGLKWAMHDEGWFLSFYEEYGTTEEFGISPGDCTRAIMALVDYMEGDRPDIQLTVAEYGGLTEMYNRQEIDHMVDVRNIYQFFEANLPYGALALAIIGLGAALFGGRALRLSLLWAGIIGAAGAALLGAWVMLDFTSFWTAFHHLFFTNDLWLMDYYTCRMIRICPESIFYSLVLRMAGRAAFILASAALLCAGAYLGVRRSERGRA